LQAQKQSEPLFGNISIISKVTGTVTYGIAACDVTVFSKFSAVMVSSRLNPVQQLGSKQTSKTLQDTKLSLFLWQVL
jgi:hypothetical protein